MRLTLQQMVANAVAEAEERTKLAQAADAAEDSKKKDDKTGKAVHEAAKEKEKDSACTKTASVSSDLVEKVASAVDYLAHNIEQVDWMKVAQEAPEPLMGAGIGATAVSTNMDSPTPGEQSTRTGQARNQPTHKTQDGAGPKDGQVNPSTATPTNIDETQLLGQTQPELTEHMQQKQAAAVRRVRGLWKHAANAEAPAKLRAGAEPTDPPAASASEEDVPAQPAAVNKQRRMIDSNQAAMNYSKGQAKAEPKRQMGQILDEPAQKRSTDPVLHENLDAAGQAGVKLSSIKLAAARQYLKKLAEKAEDDSATPEEKEKAKQLVEAAKAMQGKKGRGEEGKDVKDKESQFGMMPQATPSLPMTDM